ALNGSGFAGCRTNRNESKPPAVEKPSTDSQPLKVLGEGFHSSITEPFVAVVRDSETYAALRRHDANLPNIDAEFFRSNVVIAAFLGERNTGGYGVEINCWRNGDIRISQKKSGKGGLVPRIVTYPYQLGTFAGNWNAMVSAS